MSPHTKKSAHPESSDRPSLEPKTASIRGFRATAWVGFAFLFPLFAGEGVFFGLAPGYPFLFAINGIAIVMSLWSLVAGRGPGDRPGWDSLGILYFAALLWSGATLAWSVSYDHSAYMMVPLFTGGLLFAALGKESRRPGFPSRIVEGLVASSAVLAIYAVVQFIELRLRVAGHSPPAGAPLDLFLEQARGFRAHALFKDANTFGSFLSILFPLNLYLVFHRKGRAKLLFSATLLLNLIGLFLVASRGPAILAVLAMGAVLVHEIRCSAKHGEMRATVFKTVLAVMLLVAGIQTVLMIYGGRTLLDRLIDVDEILHHALADRWSYWTAAYHAFTREPWLGSGLNTLQQTLFSTLVPGTYTRFPHNLLVQFMAEIGLAGALLFFAAVTATLFRGFTRGRKDPFHFYLSLAFLVLVLYALFDITFQCTAVIYLFFLLAGMMSGRSLADRRSFTRSGSKKHRPLVAGAMVLVITGMAAFSLWESYRVFRARFDIAGLSKSASLKSFQQMDDLFREALELKHLLVRHAYADWLHALYLRTGNQALFERAVKQRIAAYGCSGESPLDAWRIGRLYWSAEKMEEAALWLKKALNVFPSSLDLWRDHLTLLREAGRDADVLERLPPLLEGARTTPGMDRYYAIALFELEWMLAGIYEKGGSRRKAFECYRGILEKYRGRPYLECYDPVKSRRVRMPLRDRLREAQEK